MANEAVAARRTTLPPRRELYQFLAIWLAFVNTWATFSWLREVPSLIRRLNLWDLAGSLAYTYTFALAESLAIFTLFTLLALLIPGRWLRYVSFALRALVIALVVMFGSLGLILRTPREALAWVLGLAALLGLAVILRRKPRLQHRLVDVLDRLTLLATLYLILDSVGLVIVLARNLF